MNFTLKRLLAVILALVMTLSAAALASCGNSPEENTTEADTTESEPVTEALLTAVKLIADGVSEATVIRPDDQSAEDNEVQCAMKIRTTPNNYTADKASPVKIDTDWTKDGTHNAAKDKLEILVGSTNYDETKSVVAGLAYGDYIVKLVGNKIVVFGYTPDAMNYATTIFNTLVKTAAKENEQKNYDVEIEASALDITGTRSSQISKIPHYDGGEFYSYYNPGDEAEEIIIRKTNGDEFKGYKKSLEDGGYTLHASNDVKDNLFATYYNDKYILTVGYYDYENAARIIIEPFRESILPVREQDNTYTEVTTSQITMIGLEYTKSDGGYASNGLSVLIRLSDGRFIVVDGGFNRATDMTLLINQMKSQSSAYSSKTGGIKVAAWIVTHAHGDHNGCINGQYNALNSNKIKVEKFFVNFMSDYERNRAINSYLAKGSSNWSNNEGGNWSSTYVAAAALDAEVVPVHVGQIHYLADLKLEVLYTIESYGPEMTNALNTTSLIMKMTFKDSKTGKETVYMSTGDATGPGFNIASKMFGDYLKADIVQVAHHGYTTWGTESGTISAYRLMAPPTVAWPQGIKAYPNYKDKSYNKAIWDTSSNPNYKETYVAGWEGSITTFPMPYTVGSAIVSLTAAPN